MKEQINEWIELTHSQALRNNDVDVLSCHFIYFFFCVSISTDSCKFSFFLTLRKKNVIVFGSLRTLKYSPLFIPAHLYCYCQVLVSFSLLVQRNNWRREWSCWTNVHVKYKTAICKWRFHQLRQLRSVSHKISFFFFFFSLFPFLHPHLPTKCAALRYLPAA